MILIIQPAEAAAPGSNKIDKNIAEQYLSRLPEASSYSSTPPKGSEFSGGQKHILEKMMPGILKELGVNWEPDPRLASFCRWLNDLFAVSFRPDGVAINEAASWLGLPEPHPHILFMKARISPRLSSIIKARLLEIKELDNYTHYGALADGNPTGRISIIIVFSERHLFLSPVPRILSEPGELKFKLSVYPGYFNPIIIHTLPDGKSETIQAEGQQLSIHPAKLQIRLQESGKHKLEIVARDKKGPKVLANFPVFVGTAAKEISGTAVDVIYSREQSTSKVRNSLYLLINEERRKAGLKPLEKDRRLEEIATSHSRDMVKNNFTGHISPTTGGPEQRLKSAGIDFNHFGENVGRGYTSAEAIHRSFMESPGHKTIILDPAVTHLGVGVAADGSGPAKAFLVTELFIGKTQPASEITNTSKELLLKINEERKTLGLSSLEQNEQLTALAQRTADEFSQKDSFETDELQKFLIDTALAEKIKPGQMNALIMTGSSAQEILDRIKRSEITGGEVGMGIKTISRGTKAGKILVILVY